MEKYIISVSSNFDADHNIERAKSFFEKQFQSVRYSSILRTVPIGKGYPSDFLNTVFEVGSPLPPLEMNALLKKIELDFGRTPDKRIKKEVPLDLDIICHNGKIVHADYMRFDFLRQLIAEIQ